MTRRDKKRTDTNKRTKTKTKEPLSARDGLNAGPRAPRRKSSKRYGLQAELLDGSTQAITARRILIDTGTARFEIDLTVAYPILVGQLAIATQGPGRLVVGHADPRSVHLSVQLEGEIATKLSVTDK